MCVERNLGKKICLLVQKQPLHKITRSLADRKSNVLDFWVVVEQSLWYSWNMCRTQFGWKYTLWQLLFVKFNLFKRSLDHWPIGYKMVSTFKFLTGVVSSHSDIYETCVERNFGQKIRLLLQRQSFVKQPHQNIGSGDHLPLQNQTVSSFK